VAARILLGLAGALLLGLVAPSATAAPITARPAATTSPLGTATLRGVLLLGDPATPVSGSKVTLHGLADGVDPVTASVTTDSGGRFVFTELAGGDAWTYTATAVQGGTEFTTDVVTVAPGATSTTTLRTYEVTTSAATITRPEWTVWLDVEGSTLAVQQDVAQNNSGAKAYTGTTPVQGAPDHGKAAVILPLAPGATALSFLGSFEVCCDATAGASWSHTRPVPPGDSTGTLRYEAPLVSTLEFPVATPTTTFTVLVPTGTTVTSTQLKAAGTQSDRGIVYQVLKGGPFAAGSTVTLTLVGVGSGTPAWTWVLLAVAILALLGAGWWWIRRRTPTPTTTPMRPVRSTRPTKPTSGAGSRPAPKPSTKPAAKPAAKPAPKPAATKAKPGSKTASAAPARAVASGDAQALTDELAMLDLAHESGALPDEESYQRVRAGLVERLVIALGEDPEALSTP
jgi:hypothetical protein